MKGALSMSKQWTLNQESNRPNFYPITFVQETLVSSSSSESALKFHRLLCSCLCE